MRINAPFFSTGSDSPVKCGLFNLEPRHVQQFQIGRNDISGFEHDQIAGNEIPSRYVLNVTFAEHLGVRTSPNA